MDFKYGKLAPKRRFGLRDVSAYTTSALGTPPPSCLYGQSIPQDGWGVLGNDQYGDCTLAGVVHLTMAYNAETGVADSVAQTPVVEQKYFTMTGGQDSGLNETDVLQTWMKDGLFGNKIDAYAPVNPRDIKALHQGIYYYGGLYLGIACPTSAQQDFAAGVPWTVHPGAQIDGGHCVIAVGYDQQYVDIVTWGKRVRVTYPFLANYLEEAFVVISNQFVDKGRGPALDLASLRADLGQV